MNAKIHVRDALLAALMLTGAIEAAEDDEEGERSAAASGNAGLPAWRIVAARKSPRAVRRRDECGSGREARTRHDLRRSFRCRRGKAFHGRPRLARITERRVAGATLPIILDIRDAVSHGVILRGHTSGRSIDQAPDNPGNGRRASVNPPPQSSDIGYLDSAARPHKRSR
jgi:hypothetical protein